MMPAFLMRLTSTVVQNRVMSTNFYEAVQKNGDHYSYAFPGVCESSFRGVFLSLSLRSAWLAKSPWSLPAV